MERLTKEAKQLHLGKIVGFIEDKTRISPDNLLWKSMGKLLVEHLHEISDIRKELEELRKEVKELKK